MKRIGSANGRLSDASLAEEENQARLFRRALWHSDTGETNAKVNEGIAQGLLRVRLSYVA